MPFSAQFHHSLDTVLGRACLQETGTCCLLPATHDLEVQCCSAIGISGITCCSTTVGRPLLVTDRYSGKDYPPPAPFSTTCHWESVSAFLKSARLGLGCSAWRWGSTVSGLLTSN